MRNRVYADKSGSHSSIASQRNNKIKEIITRLNLDPKSSREKYLAKKIAVVIYGYPLIDYTKY